MTDKELLELDPSELQIDETNERRANVGPHSDFGNLEESIEKLGVIQPIIVREIDGDLRVVAGQRRTLAAKNTGLDTILAVKMDIDEAEARAVSITENDSELRKEVPRKDRARATKALVEDLGSQKAAAEELGVTQGAISRRLETTREGWNDTIFDADTDSDYDTEQLSNQTLSAIRSVTGAGEAGERIGKRVLEERIPKKVVDEAVEKSQTIGDLERNIDELFHNDANDAESIEIELNFTGSSAEAILDLAKKRGKSTDAMVEQLALEQLEELGYFKQDNAEHRSLSEFS